MIVTLPQTEIAGDFLATNKYQQVFNKYINDGIIDLDKRLKYKSDFGLYHLENMVAKTNGILPPSRQTPYWVTFVKKGTGQKSIGQFTFPIKENTLFIIPKRVVHSSIYETKDCSGFILNFNIDFFIDNAIPEQCITSRKVFQNTLVPYLHLNTSQAQAIEDIFIYILKEHENGQHAWKEMIAIKILELLIQCDSLFPKIEAVGNHLQSHPVVERFGELIESNFSRERSVQFYASALNIHPNHLNFVIKKHNGINAKQSIGNRIILESKYLLSNSKFIIKEIANRLGFDDPNKFSTFFQRYEGSSPVAYRRCHNLQTKRL